MRKTDNHRRLRRGHTLIEVMYALFLAVLCVVVYAAAMPAANRSRGKANFNNLALNLAQKELEAIKCRGYAGITVDQLSTDQTSVGKPKLIDSATTIDTNTYSFTNIDTSALDNPANVLPSGTGRVSIVQVDIDLRQVIVEVRWSERGKARSVQVGSLVANL